MIVFTVKVLSVFVGSVLFNSTQIQGPCTPHPSFMPCLLQTHTVTSQVHVWSYMHLTSLVAQMVKRLPTMWETWVHSLGWEDPLEKEVATHSSILAWKIPWMEEPGRLLSMGSKRVRHDWVTSLTHRYYRDDMKSSPLILSLATKCTSLVVQC